MNYGEIKTCDIANGIGVRVSLFVSGCTHHCKGCFNQATWDFNYGECFNEEVQQKIFDALTPDYIDGLTLLGGEPFEPANQAALVPFLREVRRLYPQKSIWCYTGYTYEPDLLKPSQVRCEWTDEMLGLIDILVDGKFEEALKDISLQFRGSSNQRLIDLRKSQAAGYAVLWN